MRCTDTASEIVRTHVFQWNMINWSAEEWVGVKSKFTNLKIVALVLFGKVKSVFLISFTATMKGGRVGWRLVVVFWDGASFRACLCFFFSFYIHLIANWRALISSTLLHFLVLFELSPGSISSESEKSPPLTSSANFQNTTYTHPKT